MSEEAADPEVGLLRLSLPQELKKSGEVPAKPGPKADFGVESTEGKGPAGEGQEGSGKGVGWGMRPKPGWGRLGSGRWKAPPTADPSEQEKQLLEERLQQTGDALQQLEAELQAFQKSCLLQLARSSWVGRVLRSSTGSVEVSLAMGGPPAHPPWSAGCPLQTGASTQGPWPPWRPASWTRDEQPSLWSLPPGS